ncbi:MAG TPA: helical backbone metal receptor [Gemmatimonadales bacterium]|nr:helical backbone metal receptor [Gemmatimonadales bacterium]
MARASWIPLALLAACTSRPAASSLSVTDDWGRAVALVAPARRIVSLSPASTELLFRLGLGDRVVGRTHFCDWPPAARAVPDLGNGIGPDVEAVAARKPDLVLLYASAADRAAADRLAALGIATAVLKLDRSDDLRRAARLVGTLAGVRPTADSFVASFDSALTAVAVHPDHRPRVYVDAWASPPMTVGRGSYLSEVIRAAGADNVFDDVAASSATVSLEAIAARDPDAILYLAPDTLRAPDLASRPGWRVLRAVRQGRVLVVDGSLYDRPSPRMPQAAADLAARLARKALAAGAAR